MQIKATTELQSKAKEVRRLIIQMLAAAGSGHPGGSLSAVEILIALYYSVMRHDPDDPSWAERDRFVLSKGHAAPALYAVLAEQGYFPVEELMTLRRLGSQLQGHVVAGSPPGVEATAGSLGQGLSYSIGQALAARLDGRDYRIYCLLGDGECEEGQVWEAAMAAAHYRLDNLVAVVDRNRIQNDGFVEQIMSLEPLADKWLGFGWHVREVDGHDVERLIEALQETALVKGQPSIIIARTVKGKGVSFMENNPDFHGKAPNSQQAQQALSELA